MLLTWLTIANEIIPVTLPPLTLPSPLVGERIKVGTDLVHREQIDREHR